MAKKSRVIILEDDVTVQESLKAAFSRAGHTVFATARADEALDYLRRYQVSVLFVDCLLPASSGVDFVTDEVRKIFPAGSLDIVMMSGLFTDNSFVKDTLRATGALGFIKKPFEIEEALKFVKAPAVSAVVENSVHPRKALYQIFSRIKVTPREKRKVIEALDEIHSYDLPFVYSLLMEAQATGHLNIVSKSGDVSGISFAQGKIIAVDIVDQDTQLGKILIQEGYLTSHDLDPLLIVKDHPKKIGQRLIDSHLLSPHAFNLGLSTQMSLRLSRTISDTTCKINFSPTDLELTTPHIDSKTLLSYLHDWVAGKISVSWLRAHFLQWENSKMTLTAVGLENWQEHPPLLQQLPGLKEALSSKLTVHEIVAKFQVSEEIILKALHYVLIRGWLSFEEVGRQMSSQDRLQLLKKIDLQFKGKSKPELIEVMARIAGTVESDPLYTLSEFKRILGHVNPDDSQALRDIYYKIHSIAEEATEFTKTNDSNKVHEQLLHAELENKMKASGFYEEAKVLLQKSQFAQALSVLKKVESLDPQIERLKLHMAWAKTAGSDSHPNRSRVLQEVEADLLQVPPEDKFEPIFHFAWGLYHKAKGDFASSKKCLEKALALDNSFLPARREITVVSSKVQKKSSDTDLTALIGGFFKKR
ncbi:MAG: response regulator [Proteobacteria bacterium]|jgi:FixJ family two-component response regulator/tetratricopeptide (TPR) repeat protein|nr:response regulator [Pseudomonadota bacterium]